MVALSLFLVTPMVTYAQTQGTQREAEEYVLHKTNAVLYKEALSFLDTLNPNDYTSWDHPYFVVTPQQEEEMRQYLNDYIIKDITNPYDQAKTIYNWVHKNVSYAFDVSKAYLQPYDVFKYKSAVCGGYANLLKELLNLAGIPAINVSGILTGVSETAGHEWNVVYVNDKWFYADATWGGDHFDNDALFSKDYKTVGIYRAYTMADGIKIGFDEGFAAVGVMDGSIEAKIPSMYKGNTVTTISDEFFQTSQGVIKMTIPSTITKIKVSSGASNLESIQVDAANTEYASYDGVLFTKDLSEILLYPENKKSKTFMLPATVKAYDLKETFSNPYLESIEVDEQNPTYASYDGAIYAKDFSEIYTVPAAKTSIRVHGRAKLNNYALSFKDHLETVVLEEGIQEIPSDTFSYCQNLRVIEVPKSVTRIDDYAFNNVNLSTLLMRGYQGSQAEAYALSHNIPFEVIKEESKGPSQANIDLLEADIRRARQVNTSAYTDESVALFKQAVAKAEEDFIRYKNHEGSDEECLKTIQELQAAYGYFVRKAVLISSYSLSMEGQIAYNFYLDILPEVFDDPQASICFKREDGSEVKQYLKDLKEVKVQGDTLYKASVGMLAKQMNDVVEPTVSYTDQKTKNAYTISYRNFKIQDYAKVVLENPEKFKKGTAEAVTSMLNYGAHAQIYFNYKTDALVNEILSKEDQLVHATKDDLAVYTNTLDQELAGLTYIGSSVLIKSDNAISHYFKVDAQHSIDQYSFTIDQKPLKVYETDGAYYVDIENIYAKHLDKAYVLKVSDGSKTMQLSYSVLGYAKTIVNGNYPENLKTLMLALYDYYVAAEAYAQK